jgi:acetoin utilization protein AcuB
MVWAGIRHVPVTEGDRLVGLVTDSDVAVQHARGIEGMREPVANIMEETPHTCHAEDSVIEIAARMAAEKVGCLPVVDKGHLVGILTTTDILTAQVREAMSPAGIGPLVADVMTRDPAVAHPDDHLLDAVGTMQAENIRHLPVVDGDGRALGMVSDRDVRRAIGDPSRLAVEGGRSRLEQILVSDVMSSPAITIEPTRRCVDVAREFVRRHAGAFPVVGPNDRVIGIVSYIDLLRAFSTETARSS